MLLKESVVQLEGLKLHAIDTDKFKTNTIILKFKAPLDEKKVTTRALLPYILQSETKTYPSTALLRSYLDELYGASLSVDLTKKGEYHIVSFKIEIANELFLSDQTPLLTKAIELLGQLIFQPIVEDGAFLQATFDKELKSLKQRIQAVYDDKMRYSNLRLTQEMCKGELYSLHVNGNIEDLQTISPKTLFEYYQRILEEDEVDLYIVGKFILEEIEQTVSKHFTFRKRTDFHRVDIAHKSVSKVNEVIEKQDVKQGKLNIGYRTNVTYGDSDYHALQVFNGIFGGFSHSKLFINVREKESLAYYASSRVESHKGLLMVMSGIEFANYEKAVSIINAQMEAMKKGDFTDEEIAQTKAVIKNQLLETVDTARGTVEILYHNIISNEQQTIDDWLNGVDAITREDIIAVAAKVELDTIYFLTGMEGVK